MTSQENCLPEYCCTKCNSILDIPDAVEATHFLENIFALLESEYGMKLAFSDLSGQWLDLVICEMDSLIASQISLKYFLEAIDHCQLPLTKEKSPTAST